MGVDIETIFSLGDEKMNIKEIDIKAEEIAKVKRLLAENGYAVKKWTRSMEEDANECVEMAEQGMNKDCCGCSCSICLMQEGMI